MFKTEDIQVKMMKMVCRYAVMLVDKGESLLDTVGFLWEKLINHDKFEHIPTCFQVKINIQLLRTYSNQKWWHFGALRGEYYDR